MITPVFKGKVESGTLKADISFYRYLGSLEGMNVEIQVKREVKHRSIPQNSYFHGVVVVMFTDILWADGDYDGMKRALCEKFLSTVDEKTGLKRIKSTTELSTVEWEVFMKQCRKMGDEHKFYVPAPNEVVL